MGYALYSSAQKTKDEWRVIILDESGCCCDLLPCVCKSEAEAKSYAETYVRLYS